MRIAIIIIFTVFSKSTFGQITQLYSGTNVSLTYLSVIDKNILIGGVTNNYLAKSYHEGEQLIMLSGPGPSINSCGYQRLDSNNIFAISNGNGSVLYRSYDGGNNWVNKAYNGYGLGFAFFDTLEAIAMIDLYYQKLRTLDGGQTWTTTVNAPVWATTCYKIYGDSTIMWGGIGGNFSGTFFLSRDRGNTWPVTWVIGGSPTDFYFLNKDTIVGVSYPGNTDPTCMFTKSTNAGATWTNSLAPIQYPTGVVMRAANECYVIGKDFGNATIAKSTNLGATWSKFNTGFSGELKQLAFLNDSTALLTGDSGLLLKWNYKKTLFTGLKEGSLAAINISAFPNPVHDKLFIQNNGNSEQYSVLITDLMGQAVKQFTSSDKKREIDFSDLPAGIYFLKAENKQGQGVFKIVKE